MRREEHYVGTKSMEMKVQGRKKRERPKRTWLDRARDDIIKEKAFSSLNHLWADHRLSRTTKLRLYRVCVCSSHTHCCEAWTLNRTVIQSINGFNSRCLHVMTGEHYRETATAPAYDLVLAVRRRRLHYLGHVLRRPADRMVRCALMALVIDACHYPTGSLFSDCQGLWQWRRVVHCSAPKWRLYRELNCVLSDFL